MAFIQTIKYLVIVWDFEYDNSIKKKLCDAFLANEMCQNWCGLLHFDAMLYSIIMNFFSVWFNPDYGFLREVNLIICF